MPTLEQLQQEQVWRDEYVPISVRELRRALLDFYGWDGWRIGTIGDRKHLSGYHRSRNWIETSRFCVNRHYSVIETEGNRSGGSGNAIAAMDVVTTETLARAIHGRLEGARHAGALSYVRQVILEQNPWHVHVSFDRGGLSFDYVPIFNIITGGGHGGSKLVTVKATLPELSQGSEGAHVVTWQTLANLRGASLKVDGDFGPLTDEATRGIQTRYGAESVDGMVGPETWAIGLAGEDQQ